MLILVFYLGFLEVKDSRYLGIYIVESIVRVSFCVGYFLLVIVFKFFSSFVRNVLCLFYSCGNMY